MIRQFKGVFCPLAHSSSWAALIFLLATPTVVAQQRKEKNVPVPTGISAAEVNDRIAQLALASTAKQSDYIIGSGDVLTLEVFDVPELSREVRVNETGYISLPLIPTKVQVEGLTSFQLQDKIAELLQVNGLVSKPEVTISLKERHSQPITIVGAVRTPTVIQAVRQTTLLQALSQAGGIADDAGNSIFVQRAVSTSSSDSTPAQEDFKPAENSNPPGSPQPPANGNNGHTFTINITDLLESGDSRFNIVVLGGDIISVPRAGIIYVVGAVNHPGGFMIQNDRDRMTVMKMVSIAGGTTSTAKVKSAVILRKNPDTGKRDEVPLNLNQVMKLKSDDVVLQASDILFVPDSSGKRAMHRAGDIAVSLTTSVALVGATRF